MSKIFIFSYLAVQIVASTVAGIYCKIDENSKLCKSQEQTENKSINDKENDKEDDKKEQKIE